MAEVARVHQCLYTIQSCEAICRADGEDSTIVRICWLWLIIETCPNDRCTPNWTAHAFARPIRTPGPLGWIAPSSPPNPPFTPKLQARATKLRPLNGAEQPKLSLPWGDSWRSKIIHHGPIHGSGGSRLHGLVEQPSCWRRNLLILSLLSIEAFCSVLSLHSSSPHSFEYPYFCILSKKRFLVTMRNQSLKGLVAATIGLFAAGTHAQTVTDLGTLLASNSNLTTYNALIKVCCVGYGIEAREAGMFANLR